MGKERRKVVPFFQEIPPDAQIKRFLEPFPDKESIRENFKAVPAFRNCPAFCTGDILELVPELEDAVISVNDIQSLAAILEDW